MSSNAANTIHWLPVWEAYVFLVLLSDSLLAGMDLFLTFFNQPVIQISPDTVALQPYSLSQKSEVEGRTGILEVRQPAFSERLYQILVSEVCKVYQLSRKGRFLGIYTEYQPNILFMHRKLLNDFSKRDLTRHWDSPHQARETLSHKRGCGNCSVQLQGHQLCPAWTEHVPRLLRGPAMRSHTAASVGLAKTFTDWLAAEGDQDLFSISEAEDFPCQLTRYLSEPGLAQFEWSVSMSQYCSLLTKQRGSRMPSISCSWDTLKKANVTAAGAGTS